MDEETKAQWDCVYFLKASEIVAGKFGHWIQAPEPME